jgi:hypothetical protein
LVTDPGPQQVWYHEPHESYDSGDRHRATDCERRSADDKPLCTALYFIVDGVAEIAVGLGTKRGLFIFAGAVSILLGVLLWAQFPLSGAWALGILLGIKLLFIGLIMIMGGSAARSMAAG